MPEVRIYCEICGMQPAIFEKLTKDKLNSKPWGDVLCGKCHLVIATLECDVEGEMKFETKE